MNGGKGENEPSPADESETQPVAIGHVVATEHLPAGPHQFHFWTAVETPIGIGAMVRVDGKARTVYAVVVDGVAYSDLVDPLHAVRAAAGDPTSAPAPTEHTEIRLWKAAVLRQMPAAPRYKPTSRWRFTWNRFYGPPNRPAFPSECIPPAV